MSGLPGVPAAKNMQERTLLMELIRCEPFKAKISLEQCRIRKAKATSPDLNDYTVPGLTYSFQQCLDCKPEGKKRVEVEIMGEGKRKYTMSEAALKGRKEAAIKSGAKRSAKIRHKSALMEGIYPGTKQGLEPRKERKIKKEGCPPIVGIIPIPCCSECGIKCTEAETFDIKERLCGVCGPDIKEPVQAKAWEVTGTKRPGDEFRVSLNFTEFPEMYEELMALAKNEMRTPETQILYLLKYGNFDALKH